MDSSSQWFYWALLSAVFAALTAIFAKIGIAVAALAVTLWFGMGTEQSWLTSSGWSRILRLSALVAGGVAVYFAVLWLLGFRPREFAKRGTS